jgi:hypothetical protein
LPDKESFLAKAPQNAAAAAVAAPPLIPAPVANLPMMASDLMYSTTDMKLMTPVKFIALESFYTSPGFCDCVATIADSVLELTEDAELELYQLLAADMQPISPVQWQVVGAQYNSGDSGKSMIIFLLIPEEYFRITHFIFTVLLNFFITPGDAFVIPRIPYDF